MFNNTSLLVFIVLLISSASGFNSPPTRSISISTSTTQLMGRRRAKEGNLKRVLDDTAGTRKNDIKRINGGRGQEITGVTMPDNMKIKGWAFGEDQTIAATKVNGKYYAVDGTCPRCSFDLFKGKLLVDKEVWGEDPCVACPTCSTTYSFRTGKFGPEYKQTGLAGFVKIRGQRQQQSTMQAKMSRHLSSPKMRTLDVCFAKSDER